MKHVDIRVINKREIDMNTLTPVAFKKVDALLAKFEENTNELATNWHKFDLGLDYSWETVEDLRDKNWRIEIQIDRILDDATSYKGLTWAKFRKTCSNMVDHKYWYFFWGAWFIYLSIDNFFVGVFGSYFYLAILQLIVGVLNFRTGYKRHLREGNSSLFGGNIVK